MAHAEDVARFFLYLAAQEAEPELVTHMRLQKLLYHAQGWSLAARGRPLFDSPIEAWVHGPVVRSVYPMFRDHGDQPIPSCEARGDIPLADDDKNFVRSIWEGYKGFSATRLRQMTHADPPYLHARGTLGPDERSDMPISNASMQEFFRTLYERRKDPAAIGIDEALAASDDFRSGRSVNLRKIA